MKFIPEDSLLRGLHNSDHQSFRYLYEKYWDKLYMIAYRRLDNEQDAEEVVQDIFSGLWRKRNKLVLKNNFEAYLTGAVKCAVINCLSKRAYGNAYQNYAIRNQSELEYTTSQHVDYRELLKELKSSIDALPEKCREVFRLSREKGYSHKQISEEMKISVKTVEAHLSKAIKSLRAAFGTLYTILLFLLY